MDRRRALMANILKEQSDLFPVTLVRGDNGEVGVALFQYIKR